MIKDREELGYTFGARNLKTTPLFFLYSDFSSHVSTTH